MNYEFKYNGENFTINNFFDVDTQESGVSIRKGRKYIGEIIGIDLPDETDKESIDFFEKNIFDFLEENNL